MDNLSTAIGIFAGLLIATVLIGLILALPVMLLWDWLMPGIFGLRTITWLEAWGLMTLAGFLFKSYSGTK